jgi:glycosyltransferase involved in cell wall biosynthesis
MRAPGLVSLLTWLSLPRGKSYGVEVVADPIEGLTAESLGTPFAGIYRHIYVPLFRRQIANAACVSYVTDSALQSRYPTKTSHVYSYSSIDLDEKVLQRAGPVIDRIKKQPDVMAQPHLIFVGNLHRPAKGLDLLLEALALVLTDYPAIQLTVVGGGPLLTEYKKLAERLGLRAVVRFLGKIPPGAPVFDRLCAADLFVLPSRREGLPRALIEAMAVGLPAISTDVSGARELLPTEFIVPLNDQQSLAETIRKMLSSRERRLRAARDNLKRARQFTRSHLKVIREQFYQCLIKNGEVVST